MEEIKETAILKFNENQLQVVRESVGYGDVNKLKQDIDQLEDWIKKQNHFRVKEFDRGYLERLLIYNKGSIERTKQKIDRLCTCTNLMPDFLQNFDIKHEFKYLLDCGNIFVMPKPTKDNYRIFISSINGHVDEKYQMMDWYRYIIVLAYYMFHNDYCLGYEVITDSRNLTYDFLSKLNPIVIQKVFTLFMETMGIRMKRLHLISGSKFFDALLTIIKQGLSAKVKQRLIIHPNFESLHEYIPKKLLPKDFDGEDMTLNEFNKSNFKEMCTDEHIARVKFLESCSTDESRRLVSKFNEEYSGMPGSFKTLCVD